MAIGEFEQPYLTDTDTITTPLSAENDHKEPSQELMRRQSLLPAVVHPSDTDDETVKPSIVPLMTPTFHSSTYNVHTFFAPNKAGQLGEVLEIGIELADGVTHLAFIAAKQATYGPMRRMRALQSEVQNNGMGQVVGRIILGNTFEKAQDL